MNGLFSYNEIAITSLFSEATQKIVQHSKANNIIQATYIQFLLFFFRYAVSL